MNKLFRKTRGHSRTSTANDDTPESGDDTAKLPTTDSDQQQSDVASSRETTAKSGSDTFDVVLRLEVPSVPKLRSSSIDASCLHQGEMNDVEGPATSSAGVGGRTNFSPTGSDASSVDREPSATTQTVTSSSLLRVDLPKCFRRRSLDVPRLCIHCVHLEAMAATAGGRDDSSGLSSPFSPGVGQDSRCSTPSDADSTSDEDDVAGDSTTDDIPPLTLATAFDMSMSRMESMPPHTLVWSQQRQHQHLADDQHKLYLTSPDSQTFPVVTTAAAGDTCGETDSVNERASSGGGSNRSSVGSGDGLTAGGPGGDWKEIVTLQVPLIKPRSSSLDVTYYASTLRPPDADADDDRRCSCENLTLPDAAKHRSTSVDVSLPTDASGGSYRPITCYAADSNK